MIELTRLNGNKFSVSSDLIKYVEAAPDTTLTLVTGEKLLVIESRGRVAELIAEARASVLRLAWPGAATAMSAKTGFEISLEIQKKDGDTSSGV